MPKTKTKPAAGETKPPQPELTRQEVLNARRAKDERKFQELRGFIDVLESIPDAHDLALLETFRLILVRSRGCTTPIEDFLESLILLYKVSDEDGTGMTLEDIEHKLVQLRENDLADTIETAYFLTDRYPRPEPGKADEASADA
jgi:hypothetical protein